MRTPLGSALARGADPNPPLSHLLVMWSMRLLGDGPLAVRLPAMIFAWLGLYCLYVFLQRRVPAIYAAVGVCFAMATFAFTYAYESRSYPLVPEVKEIANGLQYRDFITVGLLVNKLAVNRKRSATAMAMGMATA